MPPSLNIPERITDLRARQQGDRVLIDFTIPPVTTDGVVLDRLGAIELRGGDRAVPVEAAEAGPVHVEAPARDWVGQEVVFTVRAAGRKGRFSGWSNQAVLRVVPPLAAPAGVRAEATAAGVRVAWSAEPRPDLAFRIWRRADKQPQAEPIGEAAKPEFLDPGAQYGVAYEYSIEAVLGGASSERSEPVRITPVDRFPPAVPSGLTATPGLQSIELNWDRNTESDLRGYRVYRATGDGPLERIAELVETPSYSDRSVEAGKPYRYAVSSLDTSGNESAPSAPVASAAP